MPPIWVGLAGLKAGLEWPRQGLPKNRFLLFPDLIETVLSHFLRPTGHFQGIFRLLSWDQITEFQGSCISAGT